jgi:hypothetical protein
LCWSASKERHPLRSHTTTIISLSCTKSTTPSSTSLNPPLLSAPFLNLIIVPPSPVYSPTRKIILRVTNLMTPRRSMPDSLNNSSHPATEATTSFPRLPQKTPTMMAYPHCPPSSPASPCPLPPCSYPLSVPLSLPPLCPTTRARKSMVTDLAVSSAMGAFPPSGVPTLPPVDPSP